MAKLNFLMDLALMAAAQVALFYGVRYVLESLDPTSAERKKAKTRGSLIRQRLGVEFHAIFYTIVSPLNNIELDEYEEVIASEIVHPDDIRVSFKDIGGLDEVIESLRETVLYPLVYPELFSNVSSLLSPPKGVLLYGPPGCGKTMMAKALAKESGATFINIHVSTMTNKWFGESQKLVKALFSLAKKLQPTIIFIDEIDSFLRERQSFDHEVTSMMKAEFMTLWDGLASVEATRIVILGATNRPNDIDKAILRRMPKRIGISLPDAVQRKRVLALHLKDSKLDKNFNFEKLIAITAGYSGSDLKEFCRAAAIIPVREAIRSLNKSGITEIDPEAIKVRPLKLQDFENAKGIQKNQDTLVIAELD